MNIMIDENAKIPTRAHENDAGADLYSREDKIVPARGFAVLDTGVHFDIPKRFYGIVTSKSGLNVKHGIVCPPGTIDSGYTGSVVVKLYNLSDEDYKIEKGDKIAQIIFAECCLPRFEPVKRFDDTPRGSNGFGSTGK